MPRRFPWAALPDDELLGLRLKDLKVAIEGTWLERCLADLHDELDERGIRIRPHAWISDEWFSPDNTPGIAIPFYLAHPRLMRLERRKISTVEGGTVRECMRILRHEAGHVIQHSYRLQRRRRWQDLFGRSSTHYPTNYRPNPGSKNHVQHLRHWYAQSHPDEDFAETFAVWLTPRANWRRRYAGWPAISKLQYVDELMAEIAGREAAAHPAAAGRPAEPVHPYARRALPEEAGALRGRHPEDLRPRPATNLFRRPEASRVAGGLELSARASRPDRPDGGEVDGRVSAHPGRRASTR